MKASISVSIAFAAITVMSSLLAGCGGQASGNQTAVPTQITEPQPTEPSTTSVDREEPVGGIYFGVNLDWGNDSAADFNRRLGRNASVYVQFARFPLSDVEHDFLEGFFEQIGEQRGIAVLTLEPHVPLDEVTPAMADALSGYLTSASDRYDVDILVRFAHEMNGSWYSWSQQPTAYVTAFRTIAAAVHRDAPRAAMLWAPNYGAGYPFSGGQFESQPGDPDFALLDTDGDGTLSVSDDPYLPYYPGDDAVDWVGMSLYHWGSAWPWGENEVPEAGKFIEQLTGNYNGLNGDERGAPDFYAEYAEGRGKPLAIVETAALYNPNSGGADELAIKQAWWEQVYSTDVQSRFPLLRMINWFEWDKHEAEIGGRIDWTLTKNPAVLQAFLAGFSADGYLFAPLR